MRAHGISRTSLVDLAKALTVLLKTVKDEGGWVESVQYSTAPSQWTEGRDVLQTVHGAIYSALVLYEPGKEELT